LVDGTAAPATPSLKPSPAICSRPCTSNSPVACSGARVTTGARRVVGGLSCHPALTGPTGPHVRVLAASSCTGSAEGERLIFAAKACPPRKSLRKSVLKSPRSRNGFPKGGKVSEVLSTAMEHAARVGLIPSAPTGPGPKPRREQSQIVPFTPDEVLEVRLAAMAGRRQEDSFPAGRNVWLTCRPGGAFW